jgi:arylsulfatase A-like enzyme
MTYTLDENVGKILAKLEELGILDNTLIVFANDNGGQVIHSFADNYPLRGMKGDVYEGGIRVPMAMMWKGHVKSGSVFNEPVTSLDFIPTFLSAIGVNMNDYPQLEGKSFQTLLASGDKKQKADRPLYWYVAKNKGAIRLGDYKMVFLPGKKPELYDLSKDISETKDLYESKHDVAEKLGALYKTWESKLPTPIWIPEGKANGAVED